MHLLLTFWADTAYWHFSLKKAVHLASLVSEISAYVSNKVLQLGWQLNGGLIYIYQIKNHQHKTIWSSTTLLILAMQIS